MDFTIEQTKEEGQGRSTPNYLLALGAGILVALVTIPVRRLIAAAFYNGETYADFQITLILIGLAIGLAMRLASGGSADFILSVLAGSITLITILVSEYLVMHFLVNQLMINEGVDKAMLIQPPDIVLLWVLEYFLAKPLLLAKGALGIGLAIYMNVKQDIWGRARQSPDVNK